MQYCSQKAGGDFSGSLSPTAILIAATRALPYGTLRQFDTAGLFRCEVTVLARVHARPQERMSITYGSTKRGDSGQRPCHASTLPLVLRHVMHTIARGIGVS